MPNGNGAVQYLKDTKHDQFGANALADDGDISDGQLITISNQAFLTSGRKVSSITDINIKWAKEDSAHKLSHSSTHWGTRVSRFDDLYNKELKELYDSGDTGTKQQANHFLEVTSRMNDLETRQEQTSTNVDQLHDNQENVVANMHGGEASVAGTQIPGAISTSGDSTLGASDRIARAVREQVVFALKEFKKEHIISSTQNSAVAGWKQWKFGCYSCGVNLSHNMAKHTSDRTKVLKYRREDVVVFDSALQHLAHSFASASLIG